MEGRDRVITTAVESILLVESRAPPPGWTGETPGAVKSHCETGNRGKEVPRPH
jgi:hypothetical protein